MGRENTFGTSLASGKLLVVDRVIKGLCFTSLVGFSTYSGVGFLITHIQLVFELRTCYHCVSKLQ